MLFFNNLGHWNKEITPERRHPTRSDESAHVVGWHTREHYAFSLRRRSWFFCHCSALVAQVLEFGASTCAYISSIRLLSLVQIANNPGKSFVPSRNFRVFHHEAHSVLLFGVIRRAVRATKRIHRRVCLKSEGISFPIPFRVCEFVDAVELFYIIHQCLFNVSLNFLEN